MRKVLLGMAFVVTGIVAAACGAVAPSPTPTPPLAWPTIPGGVRQVTTGVPFVLRGGESVEVSGQYVVFTFVGVVQDSRCPADVVCVRAGDATVAMRLNSPQDEQGFDVLIDEGGSGAHTVGNLTVELRELLPYPVSTAPTPGLPDYAVTVVVSIAG